MVDTNRLLRACGVWSALQGREEHAWKGTNGRRGASSLVAAPHCAEERDFEDLQTKYFRLSEALRIALEVTDDNLEVVRAVRFASASADFGPEVLGSVETTSEIFSTLNITLKPEQATQLRTRMRERLCDDFEDLTDLWSTHSGRRLKTGEALAEDVRALLEMMREMDEQDRQLETEEWKRRWDLSMMLKELIEAMIEILDSFAVSLQPKVDQTESLWLLETARTIASKLRALKGQIVAETYTPERVKALATARAEVERELKRARREFEAAEVRSREYDAVADLGFQDIAKEYAVVCDRIQHLTWTLEHLSPEGPSA